MALPLVIGVGEAGIGVLPAQLVSRLADMDLIGIPVRIVVSSKTLEESEVELKQRTDEEASRIPLDQVVDIVMAIE